MNIHLNSFYSPSISFLKEKVLPITSEQKKIIAIALLAFTCLAASYALLFRCFYKERPVANKTVQKGGIDVVPGKGKIATEAPLEVRNENGVVNKGTFQTIIRAFDGTREEGQFQNGQLHGPGKVTWPDGKLWFEGEFRKGRLNGQGKWIHPSGTICEGEFQENCLKRGKVTKADGIVAEGEFERDQLYGQGKVFRKNGNLLCEGQFQSDCLVKGKWIALNGAVYEGEFSRDCLHGQGKVTHANGMVEEGKFQEDQLHGQGKVFRENGKLWKEGRFYNGKFIKGKWIDPDGTIYEGTFPMNDEFQKRKCIGDIAVAS